MQGWVLERNKVIHFPSLPISALLARFAVWVQLNLANSWRISFWPSSFCPLETSCPRQRISPKWIPVTSLPHLGGEERGGGRKNKAGVETLLLSPLFFAQPLACLFLLQVLQNTEEKSTSERRALSRAGRC